MTTDDDRQRKIAAFAEHHRSLGEAQGRAIGAAESAALREKVEVLQALLAEARAENAALTAKRSRGAADPAVTGDAAGPAPAKVDAPAAVPALPLSADEVQRDTFGRRWVVGGAIGVTVSCLLPFLTLPLVGGISILQMKYGWVLLVMGAASVFDAVRRPRKAGWLWGGLHALVFGGLAASVLIRASDAVRGDQNNPFSTVLAAGIGPGVGMILCCAGVVAMLVGAPKALSHRRRKAAAGASMAPIPPPSAPAQSQ